MTASFFSIEKTSSKGTARAGKIVTTHSEIPTPVFMPVGTRATVKTLAQEDLEEMGAEIILGNTYHLYLRPGDDLVRELGGLHSFMDWKKSILTDSGGFQIYSLAHMNKVTEDGVEFQSHIDGSKHMIGPEKSMQIQKNLGSDIVMAFDECPSLPAADEELRASVELTLRWAKRCHDVQLQPHQKLFGIVQGGLDVSLRQECMERLLEYPFHGMALGGLSVGEKNEEMVDFLNAFTPRMPAHMPRYLMGVGTPLDLLNGVRAGIDMFDCVLPTRNARNGQVMTRQGPLNIKKKMFEKDTGPLDENCSCKVCKRYSRAYLRHLYMVGEMLSLRLISFHNLWFYLRLMDEVRESIVEDRFDEYYQSFYNDYVSRIWMN